jgi:RNA polymerase sigma factor (sigma-70 family)
MSTRPGTSEDGSTGAPATERGMSTPNPLLECLAGDREDQALVLRARSGDRHALEELVRRHQVWIYNIAIRMLAHPQDAEDATQEILVKALTALSSFEGRSSLRTWLYRIVVNHVLNVKRGRLEPATLSFSCYAHGLDATPDLDLPDRTSVPVELRLLVDEARLTCTSGMLLCLEREQRVIYILGEIFHVTDAVGAELLEISPANFRQRLARARRDLHNFMNEKCGLVNPANPCRCAKKTRGFIQAGYVDPKNLLFARERVRQVRDATPRRTEALATLDARCADVFRNHPVHEPRDLVPALRRLLASPTFRTVADFP